MNNDLIPYEWPGSYFYGDEEKVEVNKVIDAKSPYRFFGHDLQHKCNEVEEFFMDRLSRQHAILVNSGSAALSIAMATADIGPGDEVCIPGYMWVACISAVVRTGAIPRLVDIDDTYTMSPKDLSNKINERTKAVLLVHMSGTCGRIEDVLHICKENNVLVIEDCAQCNGATYKGKPLGSFGDLAIFSFQYNKNITAGEGGLVVCNDDFFGKKMFAHHEQGYAKDSEGVIDWKGEIRTWGFCGHMSEISAAVISAQMRKLDLVTSEMRSRNHKLYKGLDLISGISTRKVIDPQGDSGPFVLFNFKSEEICRAMVNKTRELGVKPGHMGTSNICMDDWGLHIYYHNTSLIEKRPINSKGRPWSDPLNEFATDIDYNKGALPVVDDLVPRSVLFTVAPVLSDDAISKILDIYNDCSVELGI